MTRPAKARTRMRVQILDHGNPVGSPITVVGRDAWMLRALINAGRQGFSAIDNPAPRVSHYVFKLRGFGFSIETEYEPHGGDYPGVHALYRLHSEVQVIEGAAA